MASTAYGGGATPPPAVPGSVVTCRSGFGCGKGRMARGIFPAYEELQGDDALVLYELSAGTISLTSA
jgi:hypothetical protein